MLDVSVQKVIAVVSFFHNSLGHALVELLIKGPFGPAWGKSTFSSKTQKEKVFGPAIFKKLRF